MKKGSLAVFDNDENYTESFLEYIEEMKGMPFEIQVFTKQESLLQYLESREPQLLLVASDVMCHEIEKVNREKIVILAGEEVSSSFSEYRTIIPVKTCSKYFSARYFAIGRFWSK